MIAHFHLVFMVLKNTEKIAVNTNLFNHVITNDVKVSTYPITNNTD